MLVGIYVCYTVFIDRSWAARYNTWLLIKLTPKGVVLSFLFLTGSCTQHAMEKAACLTITNQLCWYTQPGLLTAVNSGLLAC